MKDFQKILVRPDTPVLEAIKRLDNGAAQIVLVVDPRGRLIGTLTDGDTRRALLRGVALDVPVSSIMNSAPAVPSFSFSSRYSTSTPSLLPSARKSRNMSAL